MLHICDFTTLGFSVVFNAFFDDVNSAPQIKQMYVFRGCVLFFWEIGNFVIFTMSLQICSGLAVTASTSRGTVFSFLQFSSYFGLRLYILHPLLIYEQSLHASKDADKRFHGTGRKYIWLVLMYSRA